MIVEVVFDDQHTPHPSRRLKGHVRKVSTKKGSKKRGLRARNVGLLDEEDGTEDDDEEDVPIPSGGQPPAETIHEP